jgi:hypothetical protein
LINSHLVEPVVSVYQIVPLAIFQFSHWIVLE